MLEQLKDFLHQVHDVRHLVEWGGLGLICAIVFVETGLFVGFFLPGDSLLVTAGIFAKMGVLNVWSLLSLVSICAIAGDQLGYAIGFKAGQALYDRPDTWYFKQAHIKKTRDFYEKYGAKTIVIARFVPIVRTFAPVVAGVGAMEYRRFVTYNVVGGLAWVWGMVLTGYVLASAIPDIEKKLHKIILIVIFLSILPGIIEFVRERRKARAGA